MSSIRVKLVLSQFVNSFINIKFFSHFFFYSRVISYGFRNKFYPPQFFRTLAKFENEVGLHEAQMLQWQTNLAILDSKERQYMLQLNNFKVLVDIYFSQDVTCWFVEFNKVTVTYWCIRSD